MIKYRALVLMLGLLASFLQGCQSPCSRPVDEGYTRFVPAEGSRYQIQFDYPSDWKKLSEERNSVFFHYSDPNNPYIGLFDVTVYVTDLVNNPMPIEESIESMKGFYSDRATVSEGKAQVSGYSARTLSIDYAPPLVILDGHLNSIVYVERVYLQVEKIFYDFRLVASDLGDVEGAKEKFDKLLDSICVLP